MFTIRKKNKITGALTIRELSRATSKLFLISQKECLFDELCDLKCNNRVSNKSQIRNLSPFIDRDGLIRVGGRISYSDFPYEKKHPIVLPKNHHLTKLIFQEYHLTLLHAGPSLLLHTIRDKFWPVGGKNIAKQTVRQCVTCVRHQGKSHFQYMGNLPRERTLITYPFHTVGVDYAGPFQIKDRKGRGCKITKSYLCLFVCFSTKALHLELVTELTTTAFLATFRRFIARRGQPASIYSDNGTTFVGARNTLEQLGTFLLSNSKEIEDKISKLEIQWHFIPPYSPNFGGLWEAGVKSTKYHLKRVIGETILTYEDMSTLIIQIESILNSRPLTPLTSDPSDMETLTPAHFLIGRPFTTIADPHLQEIPVNRLDRFGHLQHMAQHFWNQWSKAYISELQQRRKWDKPSILIEIGTMVLLKEDNTPPNRWPLGRIVELHPGKDNITRVVTVKTKSGLVKRPVSKICILPIERDETIRDISNASSISIIKK